MDSSDLDADGPEVDTFDEDEDWTGLIDVTKSLASLLLQSQVNRRFDFQEMDDLEQ